MSGAMKAVAHNRLAALKVLVAEGANVFSSDKGECRLLFPACQLGHLGIVAYLVEQGCDPLVDDGRALPHHIAASSGHLHVLQWLITRCGVPVDAEMRGIRGMTALHSAAKHGHLHVVKWLIEKGADPRRLVICPPSPPKLASQFAFHNGHAAVRAYLRGVEEAPERAEGQAAAEAAQGAEAASLEPEEEAEGGLAGMRRGKRKKKKARARQRAAAGGAGTGAGVEAGDDDEAEEPEQEPGAGVEAPTADVEEGTEGVLAAGVAALAGGGEPEAEPEPEPEGAGEQ